MTRTYRRPDPRHLVLTMLGRHARSRRPRNETRYPPDWEAAQRAVQSRANLPHPEPSMEYCHMLWFSFRFQRVLG